MIGTHTPVAEVCNRKRDRSDQAAAQAIGVPVEVLIQPIRGRRAA